MTRSPLVCEFARFLRYAANSASELHYHLILARDTKVIGVTVFASIVAQTIEVKKMLNGLSKRVSIAFANVGATGPKAVDQPDT